MRIVPASGLYGVALAVEIMWMCLDEAFPSDDLAWVGVARVALLFLVAVGMVRNIWPRWLCLLYFGGGLIFTFSVLVWWQLTEGLSGPLATIGAIVIRTPQAIIASIILTDYYPYEWS